MSLKFHSSCSTKLQMDEQNGNLNLIKLCVGCDSVEQLRRWQSERIRSGAFANPEHVTRMRPKRSAELLEGGSLYWVIKGFVLARQRIIDLENRECPDGIMRCAIIFGREIVRTVAVPKRPFQGWRYLRSQDAPPDLSLQGFTEHELPPKLEAALNEVGLI